MMLLWYNLCLVSFSGNSNHFKIRCATLPPRGQHLDREEDDHQESEKTGTDPWIETGSEIGIETIHKTGPSARIACDHNKNSITHLISRSSVAPMVDDFDMMMCFQVSDNMA